MDLLVAKSLVTVAFILVLAAVAERTTPRVAGILSGYPLGTALVLFFYGLEFGTEFAAAAVPYNLAGHFAAQVFVFAYFLAAGAPGRAAIPRASAAALTAYFGAAWLASRLTVSLAGAALLSGASIVLFSWLLRAVPNHQIHRPVPLTRDMMALRIALSTVIVLVVTGLAGAIGQRWAGLFSAFPLVVYPLVLLVHLLYGPDQARTILKNFPRGLWTVLVYSLTVSFAYPSLGIWTGTAAGYLAATAVLLAINWRVFVEDGPVSRPGIPSR